MSQIDDFQDMLRAAHDLLVKNRNAEAEVLFRQMLEQQQDVMPLRIPAFDGLGRCLFEQGRLEEAECAFRESLELLEATFGPEHPHVAGGLLNLSRVVARREAFQDAIALALRAVDILRSNLPAGHVRIADALLLLSSHFYESGTYEQPEALLLEALDIRETAFGRESMEVAVCLNNLGRLYERRGDSVHAIPCHQESVALRQALLGDHPETAFGLGNLGAALMDAGQASEAVSVLQSALDCYQRLGLEDSEEAAICRHNLEILGRQ